MLIGDATMEDEARVPRRLTPDRVQTADDLVLWVAQMENDIQALRRGRPVSPARDGKRNQMAFRATADLKRRILAAAQRSGRSISQEIEMRLETAFPADA